MQDRVIGKCRTGPVLKQARSMHRLGCPTKVLFLLPESKGATATSVLDDHDSGCSDRRNLAATCLLRAAAVLDPIAGASLPGPLPHAAASATGTSCDQRCCSGGHWAALGLSPVRQLQGLLLR